MLKHENPNIEVINKNLWAVRFSLIPMIPQISVTHKEGTSANDLNELELTFTPDGIMILNKDHKFYDLFRKCAVSAMKLKPRQIRKELDNLGRFPANQPLQVIYRYCLMAGVWPTLKRKSWLLPSVQGLLT